jgi:hypothetical protein
MVFIYKCVSKGDEGDRREDGDKILIYFSGFANTGLAHWGVS